MSVYGPDITEALSQYANQFDDLTVVERSPIIDLNAVNELSELRETWTNVSTTTSEHKLSTSASTNEVADLETKKRGQYKAGAEAQAGIGVRIPTSPSKDEVMRWGYYTVDSNGDPLNGFYFGVDATGTFVAEADGGTVTKVYQNGEDGGSTWSEDQVNGADTANENPSGEDLSLSTGNIFQIEFTYYGYGPVEMQLIFDGGKLTVHEFTHGGDTSIENTNLPLRQEIDNKSTTSDALDLFVGGRQFALLGKETGNNRHNGHYRDNIGGTTAVDDSKWRAAISVQVKDGSNVGSIDFSHVLGEVADFEANPDSTVFRYQIRRGTVPDNPTWENPTSAEDKQSETAMEVDVASTDVLDSSSNLTGVVVDSGTVDSGGNNKITISEESLDGQIPFGEPLTLLFKAESGGSGQLNNIYLKWSENW